MSERTRNRPDPTDAAARRAEDAPRAGERSGVPRRSVPGDTVAGGVRATRARAARAPGRDESAAARAMVAEALGRLSWGPFLLAASHEGRKAAIVARSACACGGEPPLVCVAVKKGHWIGPVIRDSRRFALSLLGPRDRVALRKFAEGARSRDTESLEWLATEDLAHAGPVLLGASLALACDVVRRFDLDADCELYVGLITAARCTPESAQDAALRGVANVEAVASERGGTDAHRANAVVADRVASATNEPPPPAVIAAEYHQPGV